MKKTNNQELVASLEWLRQTVESAMKEQFKPVYKNNGVIVNDIYHVLASDSFNTYEKNCLIALMIRGNIGPMTPSALSDMIKMHISSVKRAIRTLKSAGIVVNHPTKSGFILNKTIIY